MVKETLLFFDEVLKNDLSLTNFVASDFTMLNGRLAKHYGIPGVEGLEFRKVTLPPGSHRGGVLTMASVLKVTANGTHDVAGPSRRLGARPHPGNAAAQAERWTWRPSSRTSAAPRRSANNWPSTGTSATCAACHAKIDPPGFALESFDVIGGWREHYRSVGKGEPVMVNGRRMRYLEGAGRGPRRRDCRTAERFRNIDEYKQLLLKDKDQLARALAGKLLTYATGGPPGPRDRAALDAIAAKVRGKDYGLRTLVHEVVQSEMFQNK